MCEMCEHDHKDNSAIVDLRLRDHLRRLIDRLPSYADRKQLANLRYCGYDLNPAMKSVFVMREKHTTSTRFYGVKLCQNKWACPNCEPYLMSKFQTKIASALEMLRDEGYLGFMITFTVPHFRKQSCKEVTDILYKTYQSASKTMSRPYFFRGVGKWATPFQKFYATVGIKYHYKVCEYTWGQNGWHPHFHMLFWIPRKNKNLVVQFEKTLQEYWQKTWERITLKYWEEHNLTDEARKSFFEWVVKQRPKTLNNRTVWKGDKAANGLYISKDADGNLLETTSASYLAGWSSEWTLDKELAKGNRKKAKKIVSDKNAVTHEHLTPREILEKSYYEHNKEMSDLYIEYCLNVTRKPVHPKFMPSKNGLIAKIIIYINQKGYREVLKKNSGNAADRETIKEEWDVVRWFNPKQWFKICELNNYFPMHENILYLARFEDRRLLDDYLSFYGIEQCTLLHQKAETVWQYFNGEKSNKFYAGKLGKSTLAAIAAAGVA